MKRRPDVVRAWRRVLTERRLATQRTVPRLRLPTRLALAVVLAIAPACAATPAPMGQPPAEPRHELHLPPVGPHLSVALEDKSEDVILANVPHEGPSVPVVQVWKAAFPGEDPASLRFDLIGSDGFHPASRPACTRLLTGGEMAAARIDVVTHDVSFDGATKLPRCYRVKAVVRLEGSRAGEPGRGRAAPPQ
jgi:hypothetical protein